MIESDGDPDGAAVFFSTAGFDFGFELGRGVYFRGFDTHRNLRSLEHSFEGLRDVGTAAFQLDVAVQYHLRGVRGLEAEGANVAVLAIGELGRGIDVFPAVLIPVVDVFAQDNEFSAVDGLGLVHAADEFVNGRAAGAAFGGEEFEEDGDAGGGVVGRGRG